jgi:hypothetical protein
VRIADPDPQRAPPGALGHGVELAADERAAAIGLYDLDLEAVTWSDRDIGGGRA